MRCIKIFIFSITVFSFSLLAAEPAVDVPSLPDNILSAGRLTDEEMALCLVTANPNIDYDFAINFARLYIKESLIEGVNHDIAFSQMCVETGFLNFDKTVAMSSNNFGGIGVIDGTKGGETFPSILLGVRAQIQHLKAYATSAPLSQKCVDPRYFNVRYGSAPTIFDLSGKWSIDTSYGEKLKTAMSAIYQMAFNQEAADKLLSAVVSSAP